MFFFIYLDLYLYFYDKKPCHYKKKLLALKPTSFEIYSSYDYYKITVIFVFKPNNNIRL